MLIESSASYTRCCNDKRVESDILKAYPDTFMATVFELAGVIRDFKKYTSRMVIASIEANQQLSNLFSYI
jgi:hypothetical protein